MLKKALIAGVVVGMAMAIPMSQHVPNAHQRGGKTQIVNSTLKSVTSVRSQSVQGQNNSVQTGGLNVKKGTQMANSTAKDVTVVGRQGVRGRNNDVQTGGVNIGN
jgi:hypothetical protein